MYNVRRFIQIYVEQMIKQYFKTGADFEYPLELFDVDTNASVAIAKNP